MKTILRKLVVIVGCYLSAFVIFSTWNVVNELYLYDTFTKMSILFLNVFACSWLYLTYLANSKNFKNRVDKPKKM